MILIRKWLCHHGRPSPRICRSPVSSGRCWCRSRLFRSKSTQPVSLPHIWVYLRVAFHYCIVWDAIGSSFNYEHFSQALFRHHGIQLPQKHRFRTDWWGDPGVFAYNQLTWILTKCESSELVHTELVSEVYVGSCGELLLSNNTDRRVLGMKSILFRVYRVILEVG